MSYNMVMITVSYKQILYIDTNESLDIFSFLKYEKRPKFYVRFMEDSWKADGDFDLYTFQDKIESRGKVKILKGSDSVLHLDDIFV